jgi:hypothetical protein
MKINTSNIAVNVANFILVRFADKDYVNTLLKYIHIGMLADKDAECHERICDLIENKEGVYYDYFRREAKESPLTVVNITKPK